MINGWHNFVCHICALTIIIHDSTSCGVSKSTSTDVEREIVIYDIEKEEKFLIQFIDVIVKDGHFDRLLLTKTSISFI